MFQKLFTSLSPGSKKSQRQYLDESISSATRVTVVKKTAKGSPRRRDFVDVDPGTSAHEMSMSIRQLQRQESSRLTNSNRSTNSVRLTRRRLRSPSDLSWDDEDDTLSATEVRDDEVSTPADS